jgi:hypothetical protein
MTSMKIALLTLTLLTAAISPSFANHHQAKDKKAAPAVQQQAAECPMPKAGPQHAWLRQMVGEWTAKTEATYAPGQPPEKSEGTETVTALGDFWTITTVKSQMMNMPFSGSMTMGYDTEKKQYVATWVDSMTGKLWQYTGTLNDAGNTLTLETEGVCPMKGGKPVKFRETIQMLDKNHKTFTSAMQGEDGKWVTNMTSTAVRVN